MDGSVSQTLSAPAADPAPGALDIQQLIATFRRRMGLIGAVALLVLSAVVIFTFQQTPRYTATSEVMIDPQKEHVVNVSEVMSGLGTDSTAIDTEVQILKSRSLAEKVVVQEKLDQDPEFNPSLRPPGLFAGLLSLGKTAIPIGGEFKSQAVTQRQHQAVVDGVLSGLTVRRLALTYVIQLAYTSTSPAKAAKLANAFANGYLVQQLDVKFDATRQANEWLNTKVADLRKQVSDAETAVEQYKVANNLMSANGQSLTEQEISTLDQQLATAQAQQAEQDARLATAKSQLANGSNGEDVGEAMTSPVIQQLQAQRSAQTQKIADLEGRYGERHPELLKAKRELADIDTQMRGEVQRIISGLQAQAEVARQRTASVAGSVARSKGALVGNNQASVHLNELERNAESAKALYESFLNRFKETSASQGLEQSDARVVSLAKVPGTPSYPKKGSNLAIGLILALGTGLGAAFLAEALDNGIATAEDIERFLDIPYLGAIPSLKSTIDGPAAGPVSSPIDYVIEKPLSSFSEGFRNLRASVLFSKVGQTVKVIVVTSSLPGEGKTTTSIALARTMALAGSQVVVVDCDLRRRGLNQVMASEPAIGLLEVLNGAASLEQALVRDPPSGAWILPLARSPYTPKDVFGTEAMKRLLEELRRHFDVVILDTAPVLPVADTRVLASQADVVILLVRWRKTARKAAEASLKLLTSVNAYVAGAALTQVDMRAQARYGYGDPGYYYRSYKKYYAQ
jgi:exopolysaccharide transport family protein